MATMTLSIPTDLMRAASSKLGGGQTRVKEYLLSSLQCLADDQAYLSPEMIQALMEGVRTRSMPANDAYWDSKFRSYKTRNRARKPKRTK